MPMNTKTGIAAFAGAHAIALQMKAAQDAAHQIPPWTSQLNSFDLPAAYAVAQLIHEARLGEGAVAVGRKIGFTNPDMWARYGVREPIWAHVYDRTVVYASAAPQTCGIARFADPKIEPEIVFHFHAAPPAGGDLEAILKCIDWVAHGFEIVQSHFLGWKFQAADTVADNSLHAALLVGAPQAIEQIGPDPIAALAAFSLELSCDGTLRDRGVGANVLGNPLAAIAHLTAVLAQQPACTPLQAGELVTTGTITAAHPIHAGERWQTALQGIALPGLAVTFDA